MPTGRHVGHRAQRAPQALRARARALPRAPAAAGTPRERGAPTLRRRPLRPLPRPRAFALSTRAAGAARARARALSTTAPRARAAAAQRSRLTRATHTASPTEVAKPAAPVDAKATPCQLPALPHADAHRAVHFLCAARGHGRQVGGRRAAPQGSAAPHGTAKNLRTLR